LVLDEAVNCRIERAIATAHDDEIQLRPVMLNSCRNLFGILNRCRDQFKVQVVKDFYRLSQGMRASPCAAIDEQQSALAHDVPVKKKGYPAVHTQRYGDVSKGLIQIKGAVHMRMV
jgi:hypothetical protein